MHKVKETAEDLCRELLGRKLADVDLEERRVLERIASGGVMDLDAQEDAALHATVSERLADKVAAVGGSWAFIAAFAVVLLGWMLVNSRILESLGLHPFDQYPYIFLNLMLSMLAAIQAPVIMMSQNRQAARDRIAARHDYEVNLRTQLELIRLHKRMDHLFEFLAVRASAEAGEEI
jgi:Predicted membrane protein